jgi:hypothetical protein
MKVNAEAQRALRRHGPYFYFLRSLPLSHLRDLEHGGADLPEQRLLVGLGAGAVPDGVHRDLCVGVCVCVGGGGERGMLEEERREGGRHWFRLGLA